MEHWRNLMDSPYLGAWDFEPGEERILKIKKAPEQRKIAELQGAKKVVIEFETGKPLLANSTNMKAIERSIGTANYKEWVGKEIKLCVEKVMSVQDRGELVDAIRVKREKVVRAKKPLTDAQFKNAVAAIEKGEYTVQQVKEGWQLTQDQIKALDEIKSK
jgi:hypothetical protein